MRKQIAMSLLAFSMSLVAACHDSQWNRVAPSGAKITEDSPRVIIELGESEWRKPDTFSVTVKGTTGPNDLQNGLALGPGQFFDPSKGQKWPGTNLRVVDWTTDPLGHFEQSSIPFEPGVSLDHFRVNEVPFKASLDFTMQVIPGGQIKDGRIIAPPLVMLDVWLAAENVRIKSPNNVKCDFDRDGKGRVHLKCPKPFGS